MGQQISSDSPSRQGKGTSYQDSYAQANTMITVNDGSPARMLVKKHIQEDEDFKALQKLPKFSPLMRGSLNLPVMRDSGFLSKMESKHVISYVNRYEEHLRLCSQMITNDQVMLASRMKEIDYLMDLVHNKVAERQQKLNHFAVCARTIQTIESDIQRIQKNLEDSTALAEQFNDLLPEGHKLEPLSR
ncbi:uncharacterized protein TRIADDRAFT_18549 [Trichoplax adhaerens]|uniref:BLOC-1-related complex subunit 5 n=1 Tax=Trichoplax adhaerens TaxID=10228 RepID=B3RIX6_TRIAD|nr:hypothetical protein TRIADDRAFT_18549 [Trichoplax adhaerens]EDV28468.1 hypothetical protein TRIADDRAFT_18549 [Trichoplax adhaerens]|eukprot:XP_002107670.1 hypothetical protein TRIADDRAFT_18549 [Trichoplax adhaerens]